MTCPWCWWGACGGLGVLLSLLCFQLSSKPSKPHGETNARLIPISYIFGILSSRSHFEEREAVRQTWLQHGIFKEKIGLAKFLVGSEPCYIPPQDREDEYDCKLWDTHRADNITQQFTQEEANLPKAPKYPLFYGFGFKVNHPIVVDKLGVLEAISIQRNGIKIILEDAFTENVVLKTEMSSDSPGVNVDGFLYRPVKAHLFPKGFEGKLYISDPHFNETQSLQQTWNDGGKVIGFTQVLFNSNTVHKYQNGFASMVSLGFGIYDLSSLNDHVANHEQRKKSWNKHLEVEKMKLEKEAKTHEDILLVNVTDIYRNLPQKLLKFYEWISENYFIQAVIKTDDDCLLDIDTIINALKDTDFKTSSGEFLWWSRFRYNWMVDRIGKWRELDWQSAVYPPFACGTGNVISRGVVEWLANNSRYLHQYQGEDVSMGIWLSAVAPHLINDDGWNCDKTCRQGSFNYGELSPVQMKSAWEALVHCGNMCSCQEVNSIDAL